MVLATKVVDGILLTGNLSLVKEIFANINGIFKLVTIVYGPGQFLYYGLMIVQNKDHSTTVQADEKLDALEPYPLDSFRRFHIDEPLNPIELSAF